jgi:hypothetical protein
MVDMHKVFYAIALIAIVIGLVDVSNAPDGSHAQLEAGFLFLSAPLFLVAGFVAGRMTQKTCPSCAERVKKAAVVCKHCKAAIA